MSTDWNVHCRTCNSTSYFCDANRADDVMARLCTNAKAIAALEPLLGGGTIELRTLWGVVDIEWFAQHADHDLVPVSEYGDFLDQCGEWVECVCGSSRRCTKTLRHDGDHVVETRKR